jgi:hypothetical protein
MLYFSLYSTALHHQFLQFSSGCSRALATPSPAKKMLNEQSGRICSYYNFSSVSIRRHGNMLDLLYEQECYFLCFYQLNIVLHLSTFTYYTVICNLKHDKLYETVSFLSRVSVKRLAVLMFLHFFNRLIVFFLCPASTRYGTHSTCPTLRTL